MQAFPPWATQRLSTYSPVWGTARNHGRFPSFPLPSHLFLPGQTICIIWWTLSITIRSFLWREDLLLSYMRDCHCPGRKGSKMFDIKWHSARPPWWTFPLIYRAARAWWPYRNGNLAIRRHQSLPLPQLLLNPSWLTSSANKCSEQ